MDSPTDPSANRRAPFVAIVATALVAIVIGLAVTQWRASTRHVLAAPDVALPPADTSDAVIDRALAQAPVDSTELKNRWLDEIPGLDVSMLAPAQRELLVRAANSARCTCGCGFTLATCRAFDTTCPVSGPRVEALRDSVRAGLVHAQGLRERPKSAG